jgi:hypothetical protein
LPTQTGNLFLKLFLEGIEMQASYVRIRDEHIGRGWEGVEDGACDVGDEVKATTDRVFGEDGDLVYVCLDHEEKNMKRWGSLRVGWTFRALSR